MNELPVDELRKAEALIVDGRLQEARSILANFIHGHAESAEGWFLLSFVAPERARQVECLERALKLDPWMPRAGLRLAQLSQPSTPPNPPQTLVRPSSDPRQGSEASGFGSLRIRKPQGSDASGCRSAKTGSGPP